MSRRSHLNPFFWNVFTLFANGYDHFLHCERILIMSKSLLELSFQVSMICYQFSQIVFSFYCLLTIFPLFYLSLIQLLPQFATWFSLDLIASTCHLSVLIIYLWNASHKKKESQQHKTILMIIIYFYNFVLKFIYTLCNDSLSKAQPPPFNDTYLHALSYKTFYNSFFFRLWLFVYLFFIERRWFS